MSRRIRHHWTLGLMLLSLFTGGCAASVTPTSTPTALALAVVPSTVTATATATATEAPTDTPTETPSATPTVSPTASPTATATPSLTPTPTATATTTPTRKPTRAPTVALKCPPLPPYQGQTLPFDPPLPLPLSKSGFGEFGAFVFHNSTNQALHITVTAGNVTNIVHLPPATEFSAVVNPGAQKVSINYPTPGGTECTYSIAADQVLFMQIGAR